MKPESIVATHNGLARPAVHIADKNFGKMPLTRIVTTSWDDGDPSDLRVAELLAARKLPGTFYIPVKGHHRSSRMKFYRNAGTGFPRL